MILSTGNHGNFILAAPLVSHGPHEEIPRSKAAPQWPQICSSSTLLLCIMMIRVEFSVGPVGVPRRALDRANDEINRRRYRVTSEGPESDGGKCLAKPCW